MPASPPCSEAISGITEADFGAVHLRRSGHHPRPAERDRRHRRHPDAGRQRGVPVALGRREPAGRRMAPQAGQASSCRPGSPRCSRCSRSSRSRSDDEAAANLSGGQQQMLALAMSLLARPRLLIIDELSLGLAPVIVSRLAEIVRETARGRNDGPAGRAVGERRAHHGHHRLLHGAGPDPVLRPGRGAAGAARPPARRVPGRGRGRRRRPRRAADDGVDTDGPDGHRHQPALELHGVTRRFGGIAAVDGRHPGCRRPARSSASSVRTAPARRRSST